MPFNSFIGIVGTLNYEYFGVNRQ